MWPSAFAFLAAAASIFAATLVAALSAMFGKTRVARFAGFTAAAATATYALALVGSGLVSTQHTLSVGEEKHICEIDCHLAYSVMRTQRSGASYSIAMRMRFDPETISAHRGNGPLKPGKRKIVLLDADGLEYRPEISSGLETPLRPGEATDVRLEFRIPANVKPAYLRLEDADPLKRLLIGSETAPLHKSTTFRLS